MVARLAVGSRYTEPLLILLGLGATGSAVLAGYMATRGELHPTLGAVAATAAGLFLLRWWLVGRGRRWISPTEKGFILEDRRGVFSFTYDELSDLATESTVRYGDGIAKATVRCGLIVLRDGTGVGRVPFRYEFRLDQPDPLNFFLDRALAHLTDRAADALDAGDAVRGDRWELTTAELTFRAGRRNRSLAVEEIAAADLVAGQVCIWPRGERHPAVRIPVGSASALVLLNLLGQLIGADGTDPDDAVGGLGRVLFEWGRENNLVSPVGFTLLFGSGVALLSLAANDARTMAGFVGLCGLIGAPVFLALLLTAGSVFRCHARGVFRRFGLWSRELRFEDVGRFSYAGTRTYVNGFYTGSSVRMHFAPRPGTGGRSVTFSVRVKNGDEELEKLREHVSRVVAAHMLKRIERGQSVQWTDGLRIRSDGLEWTSGGWFSRPVTRVIQFHEIGNTDIQDGHFYLYLRGVRKAVYTTPVSADNFFPGLVLLEAIRYQSPVKSPATRW